MKARVILYTGKKVKERKEGDKIVYFEHPLVMRIADGKHRKHISLGVSLPPERWINGKYKDIPTSRYMTKEEVQEIKARNAKIRNLISDTENRYNNKIRELTIEGKTVSADSLHQMIEQPVKTEYRMVLQWLEKLRDDFRAVDKIGQANVYDNTRRVLSLFRNGADLNFEEIDTAFLNRFEHFLRARKAKDSTISIYQRTFRAAFAKAVKMGYAKSIPFEDYKIPKGRANKRALSIPEMDAVLNLKNRTDDYFRYLVFSYFTIGMNFTDMARLTWDNIRGNEIHYSRQKIHQKLIIPIHSRVKGVLDYYRTKTGNIHSIRGINDQYVFPILIKEVHTTEAMKENRIRKVLKEFNKELKAIGTAAKVETALTSYALRHTAITNLVRAGVTADAIQALAGHKRLTTTENYIREASQEQKAKAVNML